MGLNYTGLAVILGALGLASGAHAAEMSVAPWPTADACQQCQVIQFGPLEFALSSKVIDRIYIAGQEPYTVHFFDKGSPDGKRMAILMSKERHEFVGKYGKAGWPAAQSMRTEQLLELIGSKRNEPRSRIAIARKAEGVENATAYIKATKPGIRTYLIQASPPEPSFLHIVVDNDDTTYTLAGHIRPELYEEFLGRMRSLPTP
jgi:hypothetical protein